MNYIINISQWELIILSQLMSRLSRLSILPEIIKYGSAQIMLESSIKPQIKRSLPSAIKVLKDVAFAKKIVSLSANQIGLDERVFVAIKPSLLKAGKWVNYDGIFQANRITQGSQAYEAIVNPVEINSCYDTYFGFQQCPSFPGLKFKVAIPIFSNIKYITESTLMEFFQKQKSKANSFQIPESLYCEQKITGFAGRVWDHQIRHLEGILPISQKVCRGEFYLLDDFKHDIQNITYYENLKKIEVAFQEKNLKKMQRSKASEIKNKKNQPLHFSQIPDVIAVGNLKQKSSPQKGPVLPKNKKQSKF